MTISLTRTQTLVDIANAIRYQNGGSTQYAPAEMSAAIAALDGTRVQEGMQLDSGDAHYGAMSESIYREIAEAIRGKNGLAQSYRPSEMAAAIRELVWEEKTEAYAVAVADAANTGKYVLRFLRAKSAPVVGDTYKDATITHVFEGFETVEYATNSKVPWYSLHADITAVHFDDVVKPVSCAYWFYWMSACADFDLSMLDTSETTSFAFMFYSCTSLTSLDVAGLATPEVTTINYMFYNCTKLATLVLGAWDMRKVDVWAQAFRNLTAITQLDFSRCVLPEYTSTMYYCFYNCAKLERIYVPVGGDLSDTSLAGYCFGGCRSLVGGAGTTWSSGSVGADMARVDGLGGLPGYFTAK